MKTDIEPTSSSIEPPDQREGSGQILVKREVELGELWLERMELGRQAGASNAAVLRQTVVERRRGLALKRLLDVFAAFVVLVVLSPVLLVIAIVVKLSSAGPVLHRQTRIGKDGQPFELYKFRSMRQHAASDIHQKHMEFIIQHSDVGPSQGKSFKMKSDPRITAAGRFLRRTSLDELPQLLNVLRGEMSLVGPRPALPYEVECYQHWHLQRLAVTPGITGWYQVKGRNIVSFDDGVRMDIYYAEHRSFWFDLKILALTPLAVIHGAGAG